jgi:hypothetical protein
MDEQELNRKLAEWRFPPPEYSIAGVYPDFIGVDKKYSETEMYYLEVKDGS